ncbi:MAG: hypothetical protein H6855_06525 [Rhodospirillales bacterium]|nr:hypothetical protein [Rhodospirillales bacterium]MCB9965718.1 hypothetical protein [Rhodospirillales bacterium]MCB9980079.1 hypothetical protein [Rhodospirillales bacterium]
MTQNNKQDTIPKSSINIPEKFKDPETGDLRVDALLKSYLALEQKLSERGPLPPQQVEDYCIDCSHGLFEPEDHINQRLFAKGFTQEQAQEVYDLAAEKLIPLIMDIAAEFQAEREMERLEEQFGGADQWREISSLLLNYGRHNLPPELLKGLASSYEGVMALYQMMTGDAKTKAPSPRAEIKPSVTEEDLHSLMRSPKYWREKDPSVIARVTKGFQSLYGR